MKWFKFYGQDFMTDPKMGYLNSAQRLLWIYLLSMASQSDKKDGILKFVTLNHLRLLAGITENDENWKLTENTLELFEEMGLVTINNETITISNYAKYQESSLTNAERQANYRAKLKDNKTDSNEDVTEVLQQSNARVEKIRIDKNRLDYKEREEHHISYLTNIPEEHVKEFISKFNCNSKQVKDKGEALLNYCKAKGKVYKDYQAFLRNALEKDYGIRVQVINSVDYITQKEKELEQEGNLSFKVDYGKIVKPMS